VTSISDLDIFARVARTGNMSAAGREMGLSPAVVSKRISQLEERLGARLFQRTTRQLMLTETGAGYFKRVVDILSLCDEAEDFVSRRNTKPRGLLKVTMPTAFGRLHIAPYIDSFLARYPEIELHVSVSDAFVDIIREGFDLAIRIGELEDSSLVARRLAPDTRVLCVAPAYVEKHGLPASTVNLEAHNCLVADAVEMWKLSGPEGDVQVRPYGTVRSDSGEVIRELVLAGVGIGLLSTWDVGPALRSGALRLVLPAYRGTSAGAVHAVYPSREFMPAKVDVLIEFLAELYGAVPYWEREIDIDKLGARQAARGATRRIGKSAPQAVAPR
jgi:DNA-binding transcriptional LysR family regulator